MIGTTLGHYRIVEKIGAGGMGVVYRAHDERLDRDVAIKVLPETVASDADRLARFEREAKAVAKLDHPNILAIHDFGTDEGVTYAVTELLEGHSLRERIPAGGVGWQKAIEIGAAVAEGLAAAHGKGIIHRDLKPENIFITKDGRTKILDFGLAQMREAVDEDAETATLTPAGTVPGTVMGTVGYMAPEQVKGEPSDARSDIFAVGCLLYEMVSGRQAFRRKSTAETQAAILKEEPPSLTSDGVVLPAEFERTVRRCLEKTSDARFQSASDLAYNLKSISTDQAVPVAEPSRAKKRNAILGAAAALVVAVVAILLVTGEFGFERSGSDQPAVRSIAILPLQNLTGDPDQAYFVDGLHEELIATFAQISAFDKVIARFSVMGFRNSDMPIREIGRQLGVDAVLEGSVRRSGDTVRATLQLIDARTEEHLWAESFDRDLADILVLQSEVARAVAGEVRLSLTPAEDGRLTNARPVNPEAYRAYLRGVRLSPWYSTEENLESARELFETAIKLDPGYAPAYVALSHALLQLAHFYRPPNEIMPEAYAAAQLAVELDRNLADAHARLGAIKLWWQWDLVGAEAALRQALELNPSNTVASARYAELLAVHDRPDEAISVMQRAFELDPLSWEAHMSLGWIYYVTGRYIEGIEHTLSTLEIFPTNAMVHLVLSENYAGAGQYSDAIDAMEKAGGFSTSMRDNPLYLSLLAWLYGHVGKVAEAQAILDRLLVMRRQRYIPPSSIAIAYYSVGDNDRAIEYLEKAVEIHDTQLWHCFTPEYSRKTFGDDPHFREILHQMNLPGY